jgi:hypothetical protein
VADNRDVVLLETVRTHRARLLAAFLFGELAERRVVNENMKRLLDSIVLAAVACAGCIGFALVTSLLASQAASRAGQERQSGSGTPGISDQPFAADHFDHARRTGWGTAEVGGPWQLSRTAAFSVRKGAGLIMVSSGSVPLATLPGTVRETSDTTVSVKLPQVGASVRVLGRQVGGDDYRAVVRRTANDRLAISVAAKENGTVVSLSNTTTLLPRFGPQDVIKIRFQVFGTSPATLRLRAWRDGDPETDAWPVLVTDGFDLLQRTGTVGIGAANGPDQPATQVSVLDVVSRPVLG